MKTFFLYFGLGAGNVWSRDIQSWVGVGYLDISGKLPTYPSTKLTICPKGVVSDNVGLGEE